MSMCASVCVCVCVQACVCVCASACVCAIVCASMCVCVCVGGGGGLETGATSLEQTEKKSFSFETYKQQGFRLTFCTGFTGAAQKLGAPKFSYRQY